MEELIAVHRQFCMGSYVDTYIVLIVIVDTNWNDGFMNENREGEVVCRNMPAHPSTQNGSNVPLGIVLEYDDQRIGPNGLQSTSYPSTIILVKNMKVNVGTILPEQ